MRRHLAPLLLLCATALCHAQQSPWQGEWGAFSDPSGSIGQRLTISDCTGSTCSFSVSARNASGHCDTASKASLTVDSPTEATAALPGESAAQTCNLHLHRDPNHPGITITATGDTCTSYYCTSAAVTFAHTYPQRSTTPYTGWFSDQCFTNAPARQATCTDPTLAALEKQWLFLYSAYPLAPVPKDTSTFELANQTDAALIAHCNSAPNPATCLRTRFTSDLAQMNAKQSSFIDGYTQRGDPATASTLAQKIAGRYRHSFANGDVEGDNYRSTDALTITPIGRASIHFSLHLEFYNGHTCDLSGGALYRKDGSFVFDAAPSNIAPNEPVCHLAIVPTSKGIDLRDLNDNACKNISCGERGGYNGSGFLFSQRVPTHSPAPK
ncbi:MAG: hypothetical protein WB439_07925 [Acidobacteriaceae bacterium]